MSSFAKVIQADAAQTTQVAVAAHDEVSAAISALSVSCVGLAPGRHWRVPDDAGN